MNIKCSICGEDWSECEHAKYQPESEAFERRQERAEQAEERIRKSEGSEP